MAMSGGSDDGAPMMDMNMTPLIDVLLVLLIMFIITIPVATHAVNIDLPQPDPNPPPEEQIDPVKNKIVLTQDGEILWNGDTINQSQLVRNLELTRDIEPEPELQFEPEALASYDLSARTLNIIKASGVTKFGFVGNEQYRTFGSGE
ncbi:biopolymer transporter ExbD [Citromicrobium bathyomarinum]|uniref:ExbD/TolR family protein n=1 Tax=Citromicrobium bathyomarinum TaxID=72174 RepID=UPI00315B11C2